MNRWLYTGRGIAYQDLTDDIDTEQVVVVPASLFAPGSKTNLDRFLLFEQVGCDVSDDAVFNTIVALETNLGEAKIVRSWHMRQSRRQAAI